MVKFICDISRRLLALLLISSLIMAVSATGTVPGVYSPTGGESNGRAIVSPEDWGAAEGTFLFSMNAVEVRNFLHSNFSFRPFQLSDDVESIYYSGTVYSSNVAAGGNYRVFVGIGYFDDRTGVFTEVDSIEIVHGVHFGSERTRIDISEFDQTENYYAFVRNNYPSNGSAYAWGTIYVYSSTIPA